MSNKPTTPRRVRRKYTGRDYCQTILDILRPTMERCEPESMMVCFGRKTIERIYANAKRGAK